MYFFHFSYSNCFNSLKTIVITMSICSWPFYYYQYKWSISSTQLSVKKKTQWFLVIQKQKLQHCQDTLKRCLHGTTWFWYLQHRFKSSSTLWCSTRHERTNKPCPYLKDHCRYKVMLFSHQHLSHKVSVAWINSALRDGWHSIMWLNIWSYYIYHWAGGTEETFLQGFLENLK